MATEELIDYALEHRLDFEFDSLDLSYCHDDHVLLASNSTLKIVKLRSKAESAIEFDCNLLNITCLGSLVAIGDELGTVHLLEFPSLQLIHSQVVAKDKIVLTQLIPTIGNVDSDDNGVATAELLVVTSNGIMVRLSNIRIQNNANERIPTEKAGMLLDVKETYSSYHQLSLK
jgi:hypothetical protein